MIFWLNITIYKSHFLALEYATGCQAKIVGKPSRDFFMTALSDVCDGQLTPDQAVMVGDDIVSDVGGAQKCGFQGNFIGM